VYTAFTLILPANAEEQVGYTFRQWEKGDGVRVAESFFSSLKKERIKKHIYKNRQLALADVSDYIETFYNRLRRHSHLGGISPEEFEAVHKLRRRSVH